MLVFQRAVKRLIILRNFFKYLRESLYSSSEDLDGNSDSDSLSSSLSPDTKKSSKSPNKNSSSINSFSQNITLL